jgi:hypothetical protein
MQAKKKVRTLLKQNADLPYLKSCNASSTLPVPRGVQVVKIDGRSSGSRVNLQAPSRLFNQ